MKQQNHRNKVRSISVIAIFLGVIFGLTIGSVIKKDTKFSVNENRVLQQKPSFSYESLVEGTYTSEYEKYVTDQFVFRDNWIALKVYAEKTLQKKDINGVYFGKDGYLIQQHKPDEVDESLVTKNIERLTAFIEQYQDSLSIHTMIVPTASYVLKDKIPDSAVEYDQQALMEQIKEAAGEEHYIDVADTLLDHKEEYIYYRTDHHWTSLGAFYAYEAAAKQLGFVSYGQDDFTIDTASDDFLGTTYSKVNIPVKADSIDLYSLNDKMDYTVTINYDERVLTSLFDMDKLQEKDKYPVFLGGNNSIVEIESNVKNGKTLLVIKDSFAHTFVPFLANHYEKIIMIDYRYYNLSTSELISSEKVTDVLFLYNTMNFVEDKNLLKLNK